MVWGKKKLTAQLNSWFKLFFYEDRLPWFSWRSPTSTEIIKHEHHSCLTLPMSVPDLLSLFQNHFRKQTRVCNVSEDQGEKSRSEIWQILLV